MEEYRTIQGDTWDMIAKKVYGAERHLDYLMASNFELLDYFIFPRLCHSVSSYRLHDGKSSDISAGSSGTFTTIPAGKIK